MFEVECKIIGAREDGVDTPVNVVVSSVDDEPETVRLKIGNDIIRVDGPDLMTAIRNALRNA